LSALLLAPIKDGAIQLGDIVGKIVMLEVACEQCERRLAHNSPFRKVL
jgi:hypothetical protein